MTGTKISDDELDAILRAANRRLQGALDDTVDAEAGLRAVIPAVRRHRRARAAAAATTARGEAESNPPAFVRQSRTGFAVLGVAALVVATAFAATAELSRSGSQDAANASTNVAMPSSGVNLTPSSGISWQGDSASQQPLRLAGKTYGNGVVMGLGCPQSSIAGAVPTGARRLVLTLGLPDGSTTERVRFEVRADGTQVASGELAAAEQRVSHFNVPIPLHTRRITLHASGLTTGGSCTAGELGIGEAAATP